ncbi:MAG TPA: HD domain-containing protein [Aggregatilineaceae bacterium]|nr:HD domain-containing protein [Aggregatilineaceae bacterium]
MQEPDFERAKQYALERLSRELPPEAYYHSISHTRDDVLPAVEWLINAEGVKGIDAVCLLTAACYHDIGYIVQFANHETRGVQIAVEVLPRFGYSPDQVDLVSSLIMATRWPVHPRTLLEEIITDADLDSLGREDFLTTSLMLREELAVLTGATFTDEEWYRRQLQFLQTHRYFTASATALRGPTKQRNKALLARLLAASHGSDG